MKSEDTRNLFLAIALSVLVMAAWQYFYAGPIYRSSIRRSCRPRPSDAAGRAAATAGGGRRHAGGRHRAAAAPPAPRASPPPADVPERLPRRRASPSTRRASAGSIDLKGGKLDDLVLKDYRETITRRAR